MKTLNFILLKIIERGTRGKVQIKIMAAEFKLISYKFDNNE